MAGKNLTATQVKTLLAVIKGFKSKAGKSFDARLKLTVRKDGWPLGSSRVRLRPPGNPPLSERPRSRDGTPSDTPAPRILRFSPRSMIH